MANALTGETPLTLKDGREFTLVLDHEALIGAEPIYGKPLHEIMADAGRGFQGAIAAIAQAAFLRHHPEIKRSDVLAIIRSDQVALTDALTRAGEAAFPDAGQGEAGKAEAARAGKTSGGNGAKRGSNRKGSGGKRREPSS